MNLCSDEHDEVCHAEISCPVCEVREELNKEIENLKEKVAALEKEKDDDYERV